MIAQDQFASLVKTYPSLGTMNTKLQEVIRDQLTPSDQVEGIWEVQVSGVAGLVCLTQNDIYTFWTQKMFFFFKFPAVQTFHLAHLRSFQQTGPAVALRAQADPSGSPDDYEENTLQFVSTSEAQDFKQRLNQNSL